MLTTALSLLVAPAALASPAGNVGLLKSADSGFDGQLASASASPSLRSAMRRRYERMRVYAPFFDRNLSRYRNAWAYQDLYAVYTDSREDGSRLRYVLRDKRGKRLYIPWGCGDRGCPQYAADPGNASFRARWIADARTKLASGYRGLWVDDAALAMRLSDASGRPATPLDPRTGREMTEAAWRRYLVEFLEQIRRALPNVEIVHNALWWAAPLSEPLMRRQVMAANWFSVEHAFTDAGLTGGRGHSSFRAFMRTLDGMHRMGRRLVLESNTGSRRDRAMLLAGYLMVNRGHDLIASSLGSDPGRLWSGFRLRLGRARGKRHRWRGVWRRDFARGTALLSDPGSRRRRLPIRGRSLGGRRVRSVTLADRSGAVVLRPH